MHVIIQFRAFYLQTYCNIKIYNYQLNTTKLNEPLTMTRCMNYFRTEQDTKFRSVVLVTRLVIQSWRHLSTDEGLPQFYLQMGKSPPLNCSLTHTCGIMKLTWHWSPEMWIRSRHVNMMWWVDDRCCWKPFPLFWNGFGPRFYFELTGREKTVFTHRKASEHTTHQALRGIGCNSRRPLLGQGPTPISQEQERRFYCGLFTKLDC